MLVVALVVFGKDWEKKIANYMHEIIEDSLEVSGHTLDKLRADVAQWMLEEEEYTNMLAMIDEELVVDGDFDDVIKQIKDKRV